MDERPLVVFGAWAPLPARIFPKDRIQHSEPTAASKAVKEAYPQQIPTKAVIISRQSRAACMREPGRAELATDLEKGAIECPRNETKTSSSSDETAAEIGSRIGLAPGRRGVGASQTQPPVAHAELKTVAEVLRTAKELLQPTNAVERQFYADCYRACQVMPASRTSSAPAPTTTGSETPSAPAAPQPPAPPAAPPALPYLSNVPEVALRLSYLGHRVVVRRVTDSRQYWSRAMTNIFCYSVLRTVCPVTSAVMDIAYVLDPGFKEHFRAGRMSDRYRDIWECLPPLFVGPPAKLLQLVQLLCSELQASFEAAGAQLPPWRSLSCTINRWMSPVFRDLEVPVRRHVAAAGGAPGTGTAAVAGTAGGGGGGNGGGRSSSSGGSGGVVAGGSAMSGAAAAGIIPAAEAQAFLRACEELLAGTAGVRPRAAGVGMSAGAATPGVIVGAAGTTAAAAVTTGRGAVTQGAQSSGVEPSPRGPAPCVGRTTGAGPTGPLGPGTSASQRPHGQQGPHVVVGAGRPGRPGASQVEPLCRMAGFEPITAAPRGTPAPTAAEPTAEVLNARASDSIAAPVAAAAPAMTPHGAGGTTEPALPAALGRAEEAVRVAGLGAAAAASSAVGAPGAHLSHTPAAMSEADASASQAHAAAAAASQTASALAGQVSAVTLGEAAGPNSPMGPSSCHRSPMGLLSRSLRSAGGYHAAQRQQQQPLQPLQLQLQSPPPLPLKPSQQQQPQGGPQAQHPQRGLQLQAAQQQQQQRRRQSQQY